MNQYIWITATILSLSIYSEGATPTLEKCSYGDTECIKELINTLLKTSPNGYAPLKIPKIEPLKSKEMLIGQGKDNPVSLKIRLHDTDIIGLSKSTVKKVSGFQKDPNGKYELRYTTPVLELIGSYEMDGQVLILPVSGKGQSNVTLTNVEAVVKFNGKEIEKNGKKYLKVENFNYNYDISRGYMNFSNLYNGNKLLSDSTHLFVNENWKEVLDELKPSIRKSYGKEIRNVIESVFNSTPYDELFKE